ncbi:MAG: transketolase family protein [Spirochaetia bacterium]|jgi:transketolase|nr:transketolase family protein [Spirochaetia bacterium]
MYTVTKEIHPEKEDMKTVFAQTMEELVREDPAVVYFDCDLMNSIGMADFAKRHPRKAVDCGIQEANMISVAAGASAVGLKPFTHTFGTFASRRVMDQVFISAAYAKLNVRMLGSDEGITASSNGGTHMPLEDIAMMRAVPGITIIDVTDCAMLRDVIRQTKDMYGVFYIRLARKKTDHIFDEGSTFEIGRVAKLRKGSDVTLFCAGACVAETLRAADLLAEKGISADVQNMFTIKPIDRDAIVEAARRTGAIVTVENHNIINGLGSAVAEVLVETIPIPMERIGTRDLFGQVGSVDYLKKVYHMTAVDIAEAARKAISRKK